MAEGEKLDKFTEGLKNEVRLEVMKSQAALFEDSARIALNIDSAIWSANIKPSYNLAMNGTVDFRGPTPMEIGNVQGRSHTTTPAEREQRRRDLEKGACVKCHKIGCRPWKHGKNSSKNYSGVNNVHVEMDPEIVDASVSSALPDESSSESEKEQILPKKF